MQENHKHLEWSKGGLKLLDTINKYIEDNGGKDALLDILLVESSFKSKELIQIKNLIENKVNNTLGAKIVGFSIATYHRKKSFYKEIQHART